MAKAPKNYYGYAYNLRKDDDRLPKYAKQRKERGFDDTELWNLDASIAKFIAPRIQAFLEMSPFEYEEEFKKDLEDMAIGFKVLAGDMGIYDPKDDAKIKKAFKLLAKNSARLWY